MRGVRISFLLPRIVKETKSRARNQRFGYLSQVPAEIKPVPSLSQALCLFDKTTHSSPYCFRCSSSYTL